MLDTCLGNPGPEPKLWREESDLTVEANGASRYVVALTRYQGFDLCTGRPRFDEIYSTALAPIADDDTITYEVAHNQTTTLTLEQFRKNCSEAKLLQEREGILAAQNTSCQLILDAGAEDGG